MLDNLWQKTLSRNTSGRFMAFSPEKEGKKETEVLENLYTLAKALEESFPKSWSIPIPILISTGDRKLRAILFQRDSEVEGEVETLAKKFGSEYYLSGTDGAWTLYRDGEFVCMSKTPDFERDTSQFLWSIFRK